MSKIMKLVRVAFPIITPMASFIACTEPSGSGQVGEEDQASSLVRQAIDPSLYLPVEEEFRLGSLDAPDEAQFFRVTAAAMSSAGDLYVMDMGNDRVAVFDSTGAFRFQFGRRGEGPGEFQSAQLIWVGRDTVIVAEPSSGRVHSFSSDGTLITTQIVRPQTPSDLYLGGAAVSSPGGWVIPMVGYFRYGEEQREPPLPRMRLFQFDPGGTGLGDPTGFEWSRESVGKWSGAFWLEPIFTQRPVWGVDGLGRVHLAETEAYVIETYSPDGSLIRRMENEVHRIPVTARDIDLWRESRACPPGGSPECSEERNREILQMEHPDSRPVVARIRTYVGGHIAVLRADLDPNPFKTGDSSFYDFFDPTGGYLGRLESSMIPTWFDGKTLIGIVRDTLGVEYVVRNRVGSD